MIPYNDIVLWVQEFPLLRWPSHLYNGNPYTDKTASLYWIGPLIFILHLSLWYHMWYQYIIHCIISRFPLWFSMCWDILHDVINHFQLCYAIKKSISKITDDQRIFDKNHRVRSWNNGMRCMSLYILMPHFVVSSVSADGQVSPYRVQVMQNDISRDRIVMLC